MKKLVFISDTHGNHSKLAIPECDILIHCGDSTMKGLESQLDNFLSWFSKQKAKHLILISGNHDFIFQDNPFAAKRLLKKYSNVTYLEDSFVEIMGEKIYGSPWQPWFYDWAFNARDQELKLIWEKIPLDSTIVVTHGPVYGLLDRTHSQENVGCRHLLNKIIEIKPKIHACGHIHEAHGITKMNDGKFIKTTFINAAVINLNSKPIEIELE